MKKNNLPIYFAFAVVLGIFIGTFFGKGTTTDFMRKNSASEKKIKRLIDYIQHDYVDTVNTNDLLDGAITEMLGKLDPHSVYIPKENMQLITENMQGNFVGIGVQYRMIGDTITVISPIKGGPSIKAGIKAGDRILLANKDTLFGKKLSTKTIMKSLKGKPNTKVRLQIYRKKNDRIFDVNIKRNKVNIKSIEVAYMLNKHLGYIKLNRFARNSYREFKNSLQNLKEKGMTDLVFDLRGNGGGFMDIANNIVDEFLEDEKLIVFTKNNKGNIKKSFATEKGSFEKGGLYVLIDENSASASEIVAGALQDNDKGIIIGRRSFGKGLVQQEMGLGDGSAVRLTIARYYTPTGRSIQKPYAQNKSNKAYNHDIENRLKNGEFFTKDSIKTIDSLKFTTPKGKIVYGGGGIIPDYFVALDTTTYIPTMFFRPLNNFAFNYVDNNRTALEMLTIEEFIKNFDAKNDVSTKFFKELKHYKFSKKTKNQLKETLKTVIARELFNEEGLYKIKQKNDKMLQKVFELEAK